MDVAKKLFDRIAFMEDGKLKEVTDIYSAFANPKSDIAKSLVQRVLNVEVPEGLKAKTNEEILRLSYTGDDSYDPVISVASKTMILQWISSMGKSITSGINHLVC